MNRRSLLKSGIVMGAAAGLGNPRDGNAQASASCPTNRDRNRHLIGQPNSRNLLDTPALVLDLDAMERNLDAMAQHCKRVGLQLRPHCKTHKSVKLAEQQIARGAIGVCAATIGEAEALACGDIAGILITRPIVSDEQIARLMRLGAQAPDLMIVADSLDNVVKLESATAGRSANLHVVVDVDVNDHRTGCADIESAVRLARYVDDSEVLIFAGLQGYAGHAQHVVNSTERRQAVVESNRIAGAVAEELTAIGLKPGIVSGGGTGTFDLLKINNVFTELQAGSYAVMDVQYNEVWTEDNGTPPFETALFVQTVVVSNNHTGFVTTDAGQKRFAMDAGKPGIARGAPHGASYSTAGDEHGFVRFEDDSAYLELGARIECITPHCDPTINLFDVYHCVRGDMLVDIWPIDARGA